MWAIKKEEASQKFKSKTQKLKELELNQNQDKKWPFPEKNNSKKFVFYFFKMTICVTPVNPPKLETLRSTRWEKGKSVGVVETFQILLLSFFVEIFRLKL